MRSLTLLLLVLASTGAARATDGPFSHTSNGWTAPIVQTQGSDITYIECIDGSNCANRTGTAWLSPYSTQFSSFTLLTSSTLGSDHFGFGVRGNPDNGNCASHSAIRSMPFLGRGFIVYPASGEVKFENFSLNCFGHAGEGVLQSTTRAIQLQPNTTYFVSVWANDSNTGYQIDMYHYNAADGGWDVVTIGQGDCLAQAAWYEAYRCGRAPQDAGTAQRAFIAHTEQVRFSVTDWYLEAF